MTRPDRAARGAVVALVRAYQLTLSPWFGGACRFSPSCSHYAIEAIERHGLRRGGWLAVRRLARCHPFGSFGADPVPAVITKRSERLA
jgi:putative membrane protein insertion efficiency factor